MTSSWLSGRRILCHFITRDRIVKNYHFRENGLYLCDRWIPHKKVPVARGFFYLMTSSWFKFTVAAAGAATNAAAARRCLSCISQWKSAVGDRVIARKFDCSCVFWYENITRKSGATFCDDRSNRSISPGIYRHLVIRTTTGEFNVEIVEIEFDDLKQEWKGMGLLPDT